MGLAVFISARLITLGGETCTLAVVHDITERKRAEVALRKLQRATEQSPASIVITDVHGTIEYVNGDSRTLPATRSMKRLGSPRAS